MKQISCISRISSPLLELSTYNNEIRGERETCLCLKPWAGLKSTSVLPGFPGSSIQEMPVVASGQRNGTGAGETLQASHQPLHPAVWLTAVDCLELSSPRASGTWCQDAGFRLRWGSAGCRWWEAWQISLRGQSHRKVCMWKALPKNGLWHFGNVLSLIKGDSCTKVIHSTPRVKDTLA